MTITARLFDAETCKRIDNLGLSSDSALLPVVNNVQFAIRTVVFLAVLALVAVFALLAGVILCGMMFLFFWLQAPNGNDISPFLWHRYDISGPFFAALALGLFLKDLCSQYGGPLQYYFPFSEYGHMINYTVVFLAMSTWKLSGVLEKQALEKRQDEQVTAALKEGKLGKTIEEVCDAIENAIQTDEEVIAEWAKQRDLFITTVARILYGLAYGLGLRTVCAALHEVLWPVVATFIFSSSSSSSSSNEQGVVGWWLRGMRFAYEELVNKKK